MEGYIGQHIDPEPEWLRELYRDANRRLLYTRMMSGHLQGRLLKMITQMIRPQRVLELGTFAGYSTLCIAEGLPESSHIDTIEIDDELEPFILKHFSSSPFADRISLHIGDANEVIARLAGKGYRWDMVFIDADKRLYPDYYRLIMPLMESGSWILADNTLWNGLVTDSATSRHTTAKNTRQLEAITEFNRMVATDTRVEKVILPLRDGLSIIHVK